MPKHLLKTITRQIVFLFAVYPAPMGGQPALYNQCSLFLVSKNRQISGAQMYRRSLCELRIDLTLVGSLADIANFGRFSYF